MLAPKDEEWNSLQSAVNLQTSRNFVIKKDHHCSTMDYLLHHLSSLTRILSFRRVEFWRFRQVWRPKLLKNLISHWKKRAKKILLYSLECLLQKRKNGAVCKGLLTSEHLEILSLKMNFTSVALLSSNLIYIPSYWFRAANSDVFRRV